VGVAAHASTRKVTDEEREMSAIPEWRLEGEWFDVCTCNVPCPCEFAQSPTNDACFGVLAFHVNDGRYGDVALEDLNVLALSAFTGNLWSGESKMDLGLFVDDRADEAQLGALQIIFGGQAGGWPATLAALVGDMRGVEVAPITIEIDKDLGGWRAMIPGKVDAHAVALSGPTTPPGARVQMTNPPGSEVGPLPPGAVVTWGQGTVLDVDAFGFQYNRANPSSKHIPFAWSGPDGT
jgi:hypothetical protein